MSKRVAVVTGGIGGLGTEICKALARAGRTVVATDLGGRADRIAQFEREVEGLDIHFEPGNVGDFDACAALVRGVETRHGPVDILVNTAGITRDGTLRKMERTDWDAVLNINLDGVFSLAGRNDPPRDHLETSLGNQRGDRLRDLGRYAVSVHVPPGTRMAQKAALLFGAQRLPQAMAVGSQAVHRCPPADLRSATSQPSRQSPQIAAGDLMFLDRRRVEVGMGTRELTAPGKCNDPSAVSGGMER
jgi:hypothetical protein